MGKGGCNVPKKKEINISVIVPITERHDDLCQLYYDFSSEIKKLNKTYEFIFVLDAGFVNKLDTLKELKSKNPEIKILSLKKEIGESTAISLGFEAADGDILITLSAYYQVEPVEISKLLAALEDGYDLVITRRFPRIDHKFNQIQSKAFHWLTKKLSELEFHDISCGFRAFRKTAIQEIDLYGDLHRFIPILAHKQGLKIKEVEVKQHTLNSSIRMYPFGFYIRRVLDILTIFFLTKFTKKPLRFFGLIGLGVFFIGFLVSLYLLFFKIMGFGGIAGRPLLLLGVLFMVLGVQSLSIGLLGEIIIFTHARKIKEYRVEEVA